MTALAPGQTGGAAPRSVLVVGPTQPEFAAVRTALTRWRSTPGLEIAACGMGTASAEAFALKLAERRNAPDCLALVGWAGGLDPALAAGDLVVADQAWCAGAEPLPCYPLALAAAHAGPVLTSPVALSSAHAKAEAGRSGAIAVEMEAYPLARWANARGLPFVHVRVIIDPVGASLPDLGDGLGADGHLRWRRLAARLAAHPAEIGLALRLAWLGVRLQPVLESAARALVQALWEQGAAQPIAG